MQYNAKQQRALTEEFLRVLSLERNLGTRTLKAYRSDLSCMLQWMERRKYPDLNGETIFHYFFYLQNEIELAARSIRRKYVTIQQYCDFLSRKYSPGEHFLTFSQDPP